MLNRIFKIKLCLLCAVSIFTPFDASAQQCNAPSELLTTLFHPDPGSYSVWSGVIGEPKMDEVFKSVLKRDGGGAIAVGEFRLSKNANPDMMLVEVDERGRKKWSVIQKIDGLQSVAKMLRLDGKYVIAANTENKGGHKNIWIGFFDEQGSLKNHVIYSDKKFGLSVNDIVLSSDNRNFVMAVSREENIGSEKNKIMQNDSGIFILDTKGIKSSERFFILGRGSAIKSLSFSRFPENEVGYIATGWFVNDYKKRIGWVMRLREDASLVWQREFERGLSASIEVSSAYNEQSILAFGEVVPADSGSIGAWLMMLDARDGGMKWQRYYKGETGAHDYKPKGLLVNVDGLISVAMQAKTDGDAKTQEEHDALEAVKALTVKKDKKMSDEPKVMSGDLHIPDLMDYVHVLTLTPRGITIAGDSYFEGKGVMLSQMIAGVDGKRLMVGSMMAEDGMIAHLSDVSSSQEQNKDVSSEVKPSLPQVELSEKTLKGLEMLGHKIAEKKGTEKKPDSADSKSAVAPDLSLKNDALNENAWVVMGTAPDAYTDPCVLKVKTLNSQ